MLMFEVEFAKPLQNSMLYALYTALLSGLAGSPIQRLIASRALNGHVAHR